jgi:hypothetical protein
MAIAAIPSGDIVPEFSGANALCLAHREGLWPGAAVMKMLGGIIKKTRGGTNE